MPENLGNLAEEDIFDITNSFEIFLEFEQDHKIAFTLPVSNATGDRLFSALGPVQVWRIDIRIGLKFFQSWEICS